MNKVMKLISILLMVAVITTIFSSVSLAEKVTPDMIDDTGTGADLGDLKTTGKDILATIRNIAAIVSVILVAVLGIKFMLGSTEEKAEYKKSFMPLIIGIVVVLSATAIANFIWDIADNSTADIVTVAKL